MGNHTNADGLQVQYGPQDTEVVGTTDAAKFSMVVDWQYDNLPSFNADLNNDGTPNGFSGADANIPAGAYITNAYIVVTTAFAGGTSYNIGLYNEAGTAIDADGIDAAVATAALAANLAVNCDGALVGGTAGVGAADGFLVIAATGTFTAGAAKLYIEYVNP